MLVVAPRPPLDMGLNIVTGAMDAINEERLDRGGVGSGVED